MRTPLVLLVVAASSLPALAAPPRAAGSLVVSSPQFASNARLPTELTCEGAGKMPQLTWAGAPDGTRAFAITVIDPDAPKGAFVHWVVDGIPANVRSITGVPTGAVAGPNSNGDNGWAPACPPPGKPHRYVFTVYALDTAVHDADLTATQLENTIAGHVLAKGDITATYQRGG
jgi:Raf kinase inhibitor-like YbhB/YbcL family protein